MSINNWWENDPAERYWMEVRTEPARFGEYLLAPQHSGTGGETVIESSWKARGTRRRAGGVPTVGPHWKVSLTDFTPPDQPITRAMLIERSADVFGTLDEVERSAGAAIYRPFQNRRDGLRAAQGYLAKFPAALVDLLFDAPSSTTTETETQRAKTPRLPRSQGYLSDAEKRVALEMHAVEIAKQHYVDADATEIEVRGKPFDLLVIHDGVERHVEVKGTTGIGVDSVQLTQGEGDHANLHQPTDLFVVDEIVATKHLDGTVTTAGGKKRL